jgi:hypothetical protein
MLCYDSPMVVSRQNHNSRGCPADRAQHRLRYPTRVVSGQTGNGGPAAAQKCAQRSGSFRCGDDAVKVREQFGTERLMELVLKVSPQCLIILTNERGGNGAGVTATPDRIGSTDSVGQDFSGFSCFDLVFRNQHYALQPRRNIKPLHDCGPRNGKTAEARRSSVIRMTFQFRSPLNQSLATIYFASQSIQANQ